MNSQLDYSTIEKKQCSNVYKTTEKDFCNSFQDCSLKGIDACNNDVLCKGFQYSPDFDETKIQFCENLDNLKDDDNWLIFKKEVKETSNNANTTEQDASNDNAQTSNNSSAAQPTSSETSAITNTNASVNDQLEDLKVKYQTLLNKYQNLLDNTSSTLNEINDDTDKQLNIQTEMIRNKSNNLNSKQIEIETRIQKIRARIDQITAYKRNIKIFKWCLFGLSAATVIFIGIYIYRRFTYKEPAVVPPVPTQQTPSPSTMRQNPGLQGPINRIRPPAVASAPGAPQQNMVNRPRPVMTPSPPRVPSAAAQPRVQNARLPAVRNPARRQRLDNLTDSLLRQRR